MPTKKVTVRCPMVRVKLTPALEVDSDALMDLIVAEMSKKKVGASERREFLQEYTALRAETEIVVEPDARRRALWGLYGRWVVLTNKSATAGLLGE